MNAGSGPNRPFLPQRALYALLAISLITNVVMVARFTYRRQFDQLMLRMQSPPVALATDHMRGNPNAAHTVIVYMDYQCPYCAQLHGAMRSLMPETNARWIYRHFPLASHPLAQPAAEAAECAGAQGKFWEYTDRLFEPDINLQDSTSFTEIASSLGLQMQSFEACVSSGQFQGRIAEQREDGIRRRVSGTPAFYIDGRRFDGMIPIDQMRSALK